MRTKGKLLICGLIFVSGAVLNLFSPPLFMGC